jgi:hypothetical protein
MQDKKLPGVPVCFAHAHDFNLTTGVANKKPAFAGFLNTF